VTLDKRCSSQNGDKLKIYQGKMSQNEPKWVFHGKRDQNGEDHSWPSRPLTINGEIVTFSFDAKRCQDPNVEDQDIWGFKAKVRAEMEKDDGGQYGELHQCVLAAVHARLYALVCGNDVVPEEEVSRAHFRSKILQRCVWHQPQIKLAESQVRSDYL